MGLKKRIKSIERITSVGNEYFNLLYLPAIHTYLESVQLAPASTAHHHAGPGGLATHTLDVIDRALRQRKSFELPLNAGSEIIFEEEHYWTYAVFIGALLHDIGKMVTSTQIELDDGTVWNPHGSSLLNLKSKFYKIQFTRYPYKFHSKIANSFFHLIPEKGRAWVAEKPTIFTELCSWLYADYYEFGMIGKIIRHADSQSVAANLKIGGEQSRFNYAPEIPLIEKLMSTLRAQLETKDIVVNGAEGSSAWCMGQFTYFVCGTIADKVRAALYKMGSTDIPSDNTRLFDIWQEHGYALPNPKGGAIWKININNRLKLTVLKFETNRVFHPSKVPGVYDGGIVEMDLNSKTETTPKIINPETENQDSKTETTTPSKDISPIPETVIKEKSAEKANEDPFSDTAVDNAEKLSAESTHDHVDSNSTSSNADQNDKLVYKPESKLPDVIKLEDPDIGKHFLTWIKEGLEERTIQVNNSKSLVHVVKEGALIVSPIAFKKFIWAFELSPEGTNINKQLGRIQERLRAVMDKKKLHRRTESGINIHTYQVTGENKVGKIKCWLLPIGTVFGKTKPPSINDALENLSGFEESK